MAIRALISDLFGVIYRRDGPSSLDSLAAQSGRSKAELEAVDRAALRRSLIGQATRQEGMQAAGADLAAHLGVTGEQLAEMRASHQPRSSVADQELLLFIQGLRPRLRTALLSDAWLDTRERIRPIINEETFDVIVISAEEGVAKPDPEIYRRTLERLGVAAEEAIFVDDWPPNVEGASTLGIHGILFESAEQMREEITRLLEETG
jgi:HAD superfamily hydrolase (TIGR01509 family)